MHEEFKIEYDADRELYYVLRCATRGCVASFKTYKEAQEKLQKLNAASAESKKGKRR